jgi:ribonuclease J
MSKNLRIIPLGGLGEIGKNMTILEYGRNQIIIDCGVMFPENDMYGIDLVLPQFDYVVENQDILRGIVLTHGHMDHIGGLPYLLKRISTPIYGTALTLGLVKRQLEEAGIYDAQLHTMTVEDKLHLGPFRVSPYPVAHSIPDAMGLVIDSPAGAVVHTGDYKLDETPAGGRTTDLKRLKQLTPNGVLAMLGDSTNADRPGKTPTEQIVADTLDELFANAQGQRIIIATFSSLLARLQAIMDLAQKHGRKIALTGRSLVENVALARELGYMRLPDKLLVDVNDRTPDGELIILSTGSQGEPRSALNRMATGQHRQIHVHQGDLIIISGGTIPGNEEDVGRMLNKLFERGAEVVYGSLAAIHVSGHGSRDEMTQMIEAVQPRFLIPAHGEARHLYLHAGLGKAAGIDPENIFVLQNGMVWASDGEKAWLEESVPANEVLVDGRLIGEIGDLVMRDRQRLSQDGFIVVMVPVNSRNKLAGDPQIISRGFVNVGESGALLDAARREVSKKLRQKNGRSGSHQDTIRHTLENFFYRETQSRPVILSNLVQV